MIDWCTLGRSLSGGKREDRFYGAFVPIIFASRLVGLGDRGRCRHNTGFITHRDQHAFRDASLRERDDESIWVVAHRRSDG